jgi:hypothetical protein
MILRNHDGTFTLNNGSIRNITIPCIMYRPSYCACIEIFLGNLRKKALFSLLRQVPLQPFYSHECADGLFKTSGLYLTTSELDTNSSVSGNQSCRYHLSATIALWDLCQAKT